MAYINVELSVYSTNIYPSILNKNEYELDYIENKDYYFLCHFKATPMKLKKIKIENENRYYKSLKEFYNNDVLNYFKLQQKRRKYIDEVLIPREYKKYLKNKKRKERYLKKYKNL